MIGFGCNQQGGGRGIVAIFIQDLLDLRGIRAIDDGTVGPGWSFETAKRSKNDSDDGDDRCDPDSGATSAC